jgi:hypothetical protein
VSIGVDLGDIELQDMSGKQSGGDSLSDPLSSGGLSDPLKASSLGNGGTSTPPSSPSDSPSGAKSVQDLSGGKENKQPSLETKTAYNLMLKVPIAGTGTAVVVEAKVTTGASEKLSSESILDKAQAKKNTTTKLSAEIKAGVEFNIGFFKVGLRAVGTMEAEVEGTDSVGDAVSKAVSEFTRWRMSDEVADVGEKLKLLDPAVDKRRANISTSLDELVAATSGPNINKADLIEETTTENFFLNPSRTALENIRKEGEKLTSDLRTLCGISSSDEAKMAADYFIDVEAVTDAVQTLGRMAQESMPPELLNTQAQLIRSQTLEHIDGAKSKASDSLKALDFKTVTPGVKVSGTIGAEAYIGIGMGAAASTELSVGGAMKFDTSKSKKEVDGSGQSKDVFDKTWDKVVALNGSFKAAGFEGSIGLEFVFSGGGKSVEGKLDVSTPPLPLGIQQQDIKETIDIVRNAMADGTADAQDQITEADKPAKREGVLTRLKKKLEGAYNTVSPAIKEVMFSKDKAERIANGDAGKTSILAGGTIKIDAGKVGGTAYVGLGSSTSVDLDVGPAKVEAGKSSQTRLVMPWGG